MMNTRVIQPHDDSRVVALWLRERPATTRRAYTADYKVLTDFVGKSLGEIASEDLVRFAAQVKGAPSTRARRLAGVKSLMGFAHRVGFRKDDPARALKLPRVPRDLNARVLTEDEIPELIKEAHGARNQALVRTLYLSGARIQEVVALRWKDLGRRWIALRGKGEKFRTVLVPELLLAELRSLRSREASESNPVFQGSSGRPLSAGQARRIIAAAGLEALGKPVSCHWLRHSHACHAVEHGVPLHVLQASLGHASLSTTSLYLHARPSQGSSQYLRLSP
jgi:integrase/recombinase XerD